MNNGKKIYNLDSGGAKSKNNPTMGELKALNQKPESKLTATERKIRDKSNIKFADVLKSVPTLDGMFQIQEAELPKIDLTNYNPPANSAQQKKTNQLLERLATATEQQNKDRDADVNIALQPRYDSVKRILYFANTPILVPKGDQEAVCKKLFHAGRPVKQPVEKLKLFDALDIYDLNKDQRRKKVYSVKDALNTLVAKHTTIKDLFVIVDKKLWFNEKYL